MSRSSSILRKMKAPPSRPRGQLAHGSEDLVRCRYLSYCGRCFVLATLAVGVLGVTWDQHNSPLVTIGQRALGRNLAAVVDGDPDCQRQPGTVRDDEGVQVEHSAVFPEESE